MKNKFLTISLFVFVLVIIAGLFSYYAVGNFFQSNDSVNYNDEVALNDVDNKPETKIKVTLTTKRSSDSTGFGSVILQKSESPACLLVDDNGCSSPVDVDSIIKIIASPIEASIFDGWINGCDSITTTTEEGDTCEIQVRDSDKITEIKFTKI
ncbi:hypothetical protein C4572_03350 [Candidatus Parcubacteria bacterium]|nr:MAG: hypothetical protein C4572_03350 [Candidatus Parcubacteria bacterium]